MAGMSDRKEEAPASLRWRLAGTREISIDQVVER
jgi:hypothetical protein